MSFNCHSRLMIFNQQHIVYCSSRFLHTVQYRTSVGSKAKWIKRNFIRIFAASVSSLWLFSLRSGVDFNCHVTNLIFFSTTNNSKFSFFLCYFYNLYLSTIPVILETFLSCSTFLTMPLLSLLATNLLPHWLRAVVSWKLHLIAATMCNIHLHFKNT